MNYRRFAANPKGLLKTNTISPVMRSVLNKYENSFGHFEHHLLHHLCRSFLCAHPNDIKNNSLTQWAGPDHLSYPQIPPLCAFITNRTAKHAIKVNKSIANKKKRFCFPHPFPSPPAQSIPFRSIYSLHATVRMQNGEQHQSQPFDDTKFESRCTRAPPPSLSDQSLKKLWPDHENMPPPNPTSELIQIGRFDATACALFRSSSCLSPNAIRIARRFLTKHAFIYILCVFWQ